MPASLSDVAPCAVLDTNVVLDWLLFANPSLAPLAAAVQSGNLQWLACGRMREEFERTLRRPELGRWRPNRNELLARFDQHATMLETPRATSGLRCTDGNDQVFLDLALGARAQWLISKDKALLRLQKRAQPLGLRILARWFPPPV